MKKEFLKETYNKIEKQLDRLMPLVALVSFVIAISIYFSSIPIIYMYIDLLIGFIFIFLSIFQSKISKNIKFIVMILVAIILSILVFFDGGFSSGFIILFTIGNITPVLLISKKKSLFLNISSITILVLLGVWGSIFSDNIYINIGIAKWITHVLMFSLFIFFFRIIYYNIIDSLYCYMEIIEKSNKKIYDFAYFDSLTTLPNGHYLESFIEKRGKNLKSAYIVTYYIKNLAFINSLYGKEVGDSVIMELSKTLQNQEVKLNLLSKTAGSELTLWIENLDEKEMENYLDQIDEIIETKYKIHKLNHKIELYVSYTKYEPSKMTPIECYRKTNIAMTHLKKNQHIRRIEYNDELEALIRFNAKLTNLLEEAINNNEFIVNYQTKIKAINNEVVGVEALARWKSPIIGKVSPAVFVPKIEEMGKSDKFGNLILNQVFSEYKTLCKKYNSNIKVSINISPTYLMSSNFLSYLKTKMKEYDIEGKNIIFEITEEVLIMGIENVQKILSSIRSLNIKVSIDDFGTGYSSFSYLENLNVDEIKIDKFFIDKINISKKSLIVIENIISLAKKLNLIVVAEGVETKEQYKKLLSLNCDIIQGYYFSKPEPLNY